MARWAVRAAGWAPGEEEWCRAVTLVQPEEKARIEQFRWVKGQVEDLVGWSYERLVMDSAF